jgi:hypothetical protein
VAVFLSLSLFVALPGFSQDQPISAESAKGVVANNRQALESQLSGAVRDGNPSRGRQVLESWGLWPWVNSRLKETGTFATVREMVLNRDENGLKSFAVDQDALLRLDESSLRALLDLGIVKHSEIRNLIGNNRRFRSRVPIHMFLSHDDQGLNGEEQGSENLTDDTYAGQIGRLLEDRDNAGLKEFLTRENLTALVLLVAMVLFVLPKKYLRKLLGIRYTFRRRIN